ncbi:UV damage repair endonuclease [Chlorella sorokiniana]|uniref:UV damage repair endonuclease n=1 Tax=Chlorella sorokiniana TaxID=3076 RepID=A0A2P6TIQ7_CHLSO|nr:UV damage repair endonuclease [Chlorella sorokiniana]|eukprot:PRW39126.1 UV damage repair endonuclease [Chlorella sorokiniana]
MGRAGSHTPSANALAAQPVTPLPPPLQAAAAAAKAAAAAAASQAEEADKEAEDGSVEEDGEEEEEPQKKKRGGRRRAPQAPPIQEVPSEALLERLRAEGYTPPPLPVPNLGYACLNMDLRELKPPVFTSRDCIKRTLDAKGLPHLGELCLANCKDLLTIIQWNHERGIRLFRMSSVICPWMGTFDLEQLPQYEEIKSTLRLAGDLARTYGQRLTFHPSHFVKLAAPDDDLAAKSIRELEAHSQIMDLLGYEPSPWNKINIHVGGVYSQLGSKEDTMRRWADNFAKLSPACRARMTVENDDRPGSFSLQDLLFLHELCGVPLVFDFHHHKFCTGGLSERDAFEAAIRTWPEGVRPVCHWSDSQAGRKPHAHSDYVRGPLTLHGWEDRVDVMIEAKCKERALLGLRGDIPIPEDPPVDFEEAPLGTEEAVALRLL